METVTLDERVNLRAVKYLNSLPKSWWKTVLKTDKDYKFETEYKKVKSFLSGQLDGSGHKRTYSYAEGKSFGRLFDHSGLQGMQKDIRGALCEGISDLDIVNCHPIILSWICHKYNIACPCLDYYITHRKTVIANLTEMGYDREDAKKIFLKSMNSKFVQKDINYNFFKTYDAEMKSLQKKLMEIDYYKFIAPKVKKGDNEIGSFLNLCLCYHENEILMKMKAFLEANELKVCTLAFDGCMHYGPESVTVLGKLNTYMRKEFSCSSLEFVYKPHSTKIAVPTDFDETSVPDKSYKEKCKEFNLTHAKVGDKYICEDICGKKQVQTQMQMKNRYNHLRVYDKDQQFIDAWFKNITDTNMRVYKQFGIHPKESACPKLVYNLWEPFTYSLKTEAYTPDKEALSKIKHLIMCLANNEEKSEKFLLDWMAQMVQYPETKCLVPVLQSEQGAGKGTLIDILRVLLGKTKVWECTDPLRDIFGNFNDGMQDAFLVNLNEVSSRDFTSVMGKVKASVIETTYTLRAMNQGSIPLPSYHRFILTTNADFPIQTDKGDRRLVLYKHQMSL